MPTGLADILQSRLNVALRGALTPRVLGQIVGNTVKGLHDAMVSEGKAPSVYQRIVDGRVNAPETSIQLDLQSKRTGTIEYKSDAAGSLTAAALAALSEARGQSPRLSGRFAAAWIMMVDDAAWDERRPLPPETEQVTIVNFAPYSERLEQSIGLRGRHFSSRSRRRLNGPVSPHLTTLNVANTIRSQFQGLVVRRQFITLPPFSGGTWEVPYVRRRPPGGQILYPSVVIQKRVVRQ